MKEHNRLNLPFLSTLKKIITFIGLKVISLLRNRNQLMKEMRTRVLPQKLKIKLEIPFWTTGIMMGMINEKWPSFGS